MFGCVSCCFAVDWFAGLFGLVCFRGLVICFVLVIKFCNCDVFVLVVLISCLFIIVLLGWLFLLFWFNAPLVCLICLMFRTMVGFVWCIVGGLLVCWVFVCFCFGCGCLGLVWLDCYWIAISLLVVCYWFVVGLLLVWCWVFAVRCLLVFRYFEIKFVLCIDWYDLLLMLGELLFLVFIDCFVVCLLFMCFGNSCLVCFMFCLVVLFCDVSLWLFWLWFLPGLVEFWSFDVWGWYKTVLDVWLFGFWMRLVFLVFLVEFCLDLRMWRWFGVYFALSLLFWWVCVVYCVWWTWLLAMIFSVDTLGFDYGWWLVVFAGWLFIVLVWFDGFKGYFVIAVV